MPTPLSTFLDQAPRLDQTLRGRRLRERELYYQGRQYEDRALDAEGYLKGQAGVFGSSVRTPSWSERDPRSVWNLVGIAVRELTRWTLGGENFCHLQVTGDAEATDWLNTVARAAGLQQALVRARHFGGSQGTAIVSMAVRDGLVAFEAHSPRQTWAIGWRDEAAHVPSEVVHLFLGDNPLATRPEELPLCARVWTEQDEAILRREQDPRTGEWRWVQVSRVAHGLGLCPVVWHPQLAHDGQHDGTPDGDRPTLSKVDEVNELLAAGSTTTRRNADDTLVMKMDPSKNPGHVRKGGANVIWSTGGAEYLSQDGASAKVCAEQAMLAAEHVWQGFGVVMPSLDTLGRATTAEMLKRLWQATIHTSGELRQDYARGLIVPLCRMVLAVGRQLANRGQQLRLPPREEENAEFGVTVVAPRTPGKFEFVECVWPPAITPTIDDLQKMLTAATGATGGEQVMSLRTAVTWLKNSPLPIQSVEEELKALEHDADARAERGAKALGLDEPPPGQAGAVESKEPDGDEPANDEAKPAAAE